MVEWLREVWDRTPAAPLKKKQALVYDACKGHLKEKVNILTSIETQNLVTILGVMISQLQLLDIVVNNHSETNYKTCMGNGCGMGIAQWQQQET
jgi:hypothetical protein